MKNMAPDTFDRHLVACLQRALEPRREILEAYLFGSRARGDDHGNSDIDVAVSSTWSAHKLDSGAMRPS